MNRSLTAFAASACLALASTAGNSRAEPAAVAAQQGCDVFGPVTPNVHVSQSWFYDQIWSQVARRSSGIACAWSEGQDIWARLFDPSLQPITDAFLVNTTLNLDVQDEPAIAYATGGNFLVAWSERHGYDGEQMGIFARLYDVHGAPLTSEFQVNVNWAASQWRPLIASTPSGGFVVAWSGNWDGDAFFRIFNGNGAPLTGDILVNVFPWDAQVDPAPAVNADGTIFIAFIDYSSHGNVGSGINIYGRMYDSSGAPLQAQEFVLTTYSGNGDQREPRVAADRFGRFIVTYEDDSTGVTRVLGQRFDAAAHRVGGEFVVSQDPLNATHNRTIAMDEIGSDLLLGFDIAGPPSPPGNGIDVFVRRFADSHGPLTYCSAKANSQGCLPAIGYTGDASIGNQSPFLITAANVVNKKTGLLFYASESSFTPFQGGLLCVSQPLHRTPSQNSGGSTGGSDCSGHLSFDFNAYVASGVDPALTAGKTISAQYYYRDPLDPAGFGTGLSNGLRFTICP